MDANKEAEKDEAAVLAQARINAPIQWESLPDFKIQDLNEAHFEEALRLIKHHFFAEEPMCKASFLLEDSLSVRCYLDLIRTWMRDTTSIIALSAKTGRIVGVAVTRINYLSDRSNTYSRIQIFQGEALGQIMHLKSVLIKQTGVYEKLKIDSHFRVYILCVHPSYAEKGVGSALLENTIHVARSLKVPAICGIFTSGTSQGIAKSLGFRNLSEILYSRWVVDDEVVFDDPGIGNYSAALMGMLVPERDQEEEKRKKRIQKLKVNEVHYIGAQRKGASS